MRKSNKTKLIILGGFLGSGKTTLMMQISRLLRKNDQKVAVITNDQGGFLVDTAFSSGNGIPSAEVTAGCFCCNFPDLISNIKTLAEEHSPDYIIAEAVGSCTDLNATVLLPLQKYHRDLVELAAYFVLVDGSRTVDEYRNMDLVHPASPKEILVSHQISEASDIVLSKTDFLEDDEIAQSIDYIGSINSSARIYPVSARTGNNLDELLNLISGSEGLIVDKTIPLDYDIYAMAEAEYGWYNGVLNFVFPRSYDREMLGREMMSFLSSAIEGEIAHGKVLVSSGDGAVKVSLVSGQIHCDSTGPAEDTAKAECTLNLRAATDPESIVKAVDLMIDHFKKTYNGWLDLYTYSSLVPAPPEPTHRLELVV